MGMESSFVNLKVKNENKNSDTSMQRTLKDEQNKVKTVNSICKLKRKREKELRKLKKAKLQQCAAAKPKQVRAKLAGQVCLLVSSDEEDEKKPLPVITVVKATSKANLSSSCKSRKNITGDLMDNRLNEPPSRAKIFVPNEQQDDHQNISKAKTS